MKVNLNEGAQQGDGKKYEPIPEGQYLVKVLSERDKTDSYSRTKLELTLEVQEGPFRGRRIWDNMPMSGFSPKVVDISTRRLRDLFRCLGLPADGDMDTAELVNGLALARVVHSVGESKVFVNVSGYEAAALPDDSPGDEGLPF